MFGSPIVDLPRTAPDQEPINSELPENENLFDAFGDEMIDLEDDLPEIEMPNQAKRGAAVRAPIYATPESRPERTLPRAAREQIATEQTASQPAADLGNDPFQALMAKYAK